MALEKFRRKGLYDKQNTPLSNEELKKEIKKVNKVEHKVKENKNENE